MLTKLINNSARLPSAAEIIKKGGLVAVPTETVYGLAANGLDPLAVEKIYEVKGRPAVKPLSLMVHGIEDMEKYCENVPQEAKVLAEKFWPGPLTIVLKAKDIVPEIVRAGGETVGLRCPDHEMTLKTIELAGVPLAAPSANPSGAPSPKKAEEVLAYFDGKIDGVIDGGECGIGRESTLIDMSAAPYKILRRGALGEEDIADALVGNMKIIGITGGTGCGKTTALNLLENFGALIIDCDELYHDLLTESGEMLAEIDKAFPGTVIHGVLDRKALGNIVFTDENKLKNLNEITGKYIEAELENRLRTRAMAGGKLAVIDAIGLFSAGIDKRCNFTIGVIADTESRASRIMQRDGISEEYARERIAAQEPNEYFIRHCDYILENNGTREEFLDCCLKLYLEVL